MVNGSQTVGSGNGTLPLFARASAAAEALSAESAGIADAAASQPADQVVIPTGETYRYNSFEFSYRQDFGKIVLLRQKPDTGEVVQQFPSEYYLQKYADSERVARNAESYGKAKSARAVASDQDNTAATVIPPASANGATVVPVVDAAPAISSAPALPSASGAGRVNLTI